MAIGFVQFFQPSGGACPVHVQTEILRCGMGLRLHSTIAALRAAISAPPVAGVSQLVLLAADPAQSCRAASAVRRADPAINIVALLPSVDDVILVQAMHSGIDICWSSRAPARQIASGLMRWVSAPPSAAAHMGRAPEHEQEWVLTSRAWALQPPGGGAIMLTAAERALLLALCQAPGQRLSHAALLHAIDPSAAIASALSRTQAALFARRLSVLISRLRQKFSAVGADMPIRSLRGVGYELCVPFTSLERQAPQAAEPLPYCHDA